MKAKKLLYLCIIVISAIIGLIVGNKYVDYKDYQTTYAATTTVMGSKQIPSDVYSRSTTIDYSILVFYYQELIDGIFVCEAASNSLAEQKIFISTEDIQDMITYSAYGPSTLSITAESSDYYTAINVANAVADEYINQINLIAGSNTGNTVDKAIYAYIYNDGHKQSLITIGTFTLVFPIVTMLVIFLFILTYRLLYPKG